MRGRAASSDGLYEVTAGSYSQEFVGTDALRDAQGYFKKIQKVLRDEHVQRGDDSTAPTVIKIVAPLDKIVLTKLVYHFGRAAWEKGF